MNPLSRFKRKNLKKKCYDIDSAISLLKETGTAKFTETVELHANLNIDPKTYPNQQIRATLTLPHGTGHSTKIATLVPDNLNKEALSAGSDIVNENNNLLQDIEKGIINFDILITTPDMIPKIAKFGRILGPKGLMPSQKRGTLTTNFQKTINDFKAGKFEYKTDKTGVIHTRFGKVDFSNVQLKENLIKLITSIKQNRPNSVKGTYLKTLYLCTTMGPSIKVEDRNVYKKV